jgi:hypothetical protein
MGSNVSTNCEIIESDTKSSLPKLRNSSNDDADYDSDAFDDEILFERNDHICHISDNECRALRLFANDNSLCLPEITEPDAFSETFIQRRQQAIDNQTYRKTIDRWTKVKTMKQLIAVIKYHTRGKSIIDRAWFVFYWVISNIDYDPISLIPGKRADQSPDAVFRTRKGVCAGYAYLFKYLCVQVGIKCEYVSGFTKDEILKHPERAPIHSDHAWNTVQIGSYWYLAEPTWASGYLTNNKTRFVRSLNLYYFLVRPDQFIYSHLPKDNKWQHIVDRINMVQYSQLPDVYPAYFGLHLELVSPRMQANVTLVPGKPFALVIIRTPSYVSLSARLTLNDEEVLGGCKIRYSQSNLYHCYFAPAAVGLHKITIYGYYLDDKDGSCAIELKFDVPQLPNRLVSFPRKWNAFWEHNIVVIYPQNTHAIKLDSVTKNHSQILIRTSTNIELKGSLRNNIGNKVKGGDRVYFDRRKNIWRCKFAPDRKGIFQARILARKKSTLEDTSFQPVIAFMLKVDNLESPISYPKLFQHFYDLNLRLLSPTSQTRLTCSEDLHTAKICIHSPANIQLTCHMEHAGNILKHGPFSQFNTDQQQWEFLFAPRCASMHHLIISTQSDDDQLLKVAQFYLNITRYFCPTSFPRIYQPFHTARCYIHEPLEGRLQFDATVLFLYYLPSAKEVLVEIDDDKKTSYSLNDSLFQQTIKIGYKKLIVHARFDENYEALVQYFEIKPETHDAFIQYFKQ